MFQYFFAGGFAVGAGIHKTLCMIRSNLAFSIISFLLGINHLTFSCYAISIDINNRDVYPCTDYYYAVGDGSSRPSSRPIYDSRRSSRSSDLFPKL